MNFFSKLNSAIAQNQSLLVVGLDPNPEMMPPGCDFQEDIERAHHIINKNYVKKS